MLHYREDLTGFTPLMALVTYLLFPPAFSALVEMGSGWRAWLFGAGLTEVVFGLPALLAWGAQGVRVTDRAVTVGYPVLPARLRLPGALETVQIPLGAIAAYEVVSGEALRARRRGMRSWVPVSGTTRRRRVIAAGLKAPLWARHGLWIRLAEGTTHIGASRGSHIWVGYARVPNPYFESDEWLIATRHPRRLEAALQAVLHQRRTEGGSPDGAGPERPGDEDLWTRWRRQDAANDRSHGRAPHDRP